MLNFNRLMWNVHWERFSVHLAKYLTMPRNLVTSCFFGVLILQLASFLLGLISTSLQWVGHLEMLILLWQSGIFLCSELHCLTCKTFFIVSRCDFVSLLQITMLSIEVSMFWMPLKICHIILWYISGAEDFQNGILW